LKESKGYTQKPSFQCCKGSHGYNNSRSSPSAGTESLPFRYHLAPLELAAERQLHFRWSTSLYEDGGPVRSCNNGKERSTPREVVVDPSQPAPASPDGRPAFIPPCVLGISCKRPRGGQRMIQLSLSGPDKLSQSNRYDPATVFRPARWERPDPSATESNSWAEHAILERSSECSEPVYFQDIPVLTSALAELGH